MPLRTAVVVACLASVAWGCGGSTSHAVAAKDYPRSCVDVADCAPITEGAIGCCGLEACPNAAIRADAVARYTNDLNARTPTCAPSPPCGPPPICTSGRVACTNGVCALLEPKSDGADDD